MRTRGWDEEYTRRRRSKGEPHWNELAGDDPRWPAKCEPLLRYLAQTRHTSEVMCWGRLRGLPREEVTSMLAWLDNEGLIERIDAGYWRARGSGV